MSTVYFYIYEILNFARRGNKGFKKSNAWHFNETSTYLLVVPICVLLFYSRIDYPQF